MEYPFELLPRKTLIPPDLDENSLFVRLVETIPSGYFIEDDFLPEIVDEVLKPNGDREVYRLSLFLYGIYNENHFRIKVTDNSLFDDWDRVEKLEPYDVVFEPHNYYGVFLRYSTLIKNCDKLKDENGNEFLLCYRHSPTRCNFWHFEQYVINKGDKDRKPLRSDLKTKTQKI